MKEGQTGKYGVWLSEFVQIAIASTRAGAWTDQQQQRRRQQKNGITRHTLWRRLQPPAPSRSSSVLHSWILARSLSHSRTYP
ncbi:hypothetical protein I305_03261 [Cryptococcus gattii E566]|nr:hypothetical protein I305_03261 [Cryptococcus gattii E566]